MEMKLDLDEASDGQEQALIRGLRHAPAVVARTGKSAKAAREKRSNNFLRSKRRRGIREKNEHRRGECQGAFPESESFHSFRAGSCFIVSVSVAVWRRRESAPSTIAPS